MILNRNRLVRRARRKPREKKIAARILGGEKKRFHAAIFFLAVFFRVTHEGLSERGTTRSLLSRQNEGQIPVTNAFQFTSIGGF